jgi:haloacid dehalogenase-like hydrolase
MNIFFDVDETLIAYDGSLRPGARSVFERLVSDGHRVYVWSGRGIRTSDVHRTGLGDLVSGIYQKPLSDFKAGLARCGIPALPDFVIDDYPGIVEFFGGLCIRPYHGGAQADNELSDIPDLVRGLGSARVRLRETAAPLDDAPRSRPQGTATSWPCRCSHGRCTIYWRLRETGLRCPAPRPGSGAQRCVRAPVPSAASGLVMIVDAPGAARVPGRMLTGLSMRRGTIRVRPVPRSPAVGLVAVEEPGPLLRLVRGELAHNDDLVHRSRGHGDRDTRSGTRQNPAAPPGRGRRRGGTG